MNEETWKGVVDKDFPEIEEVTREMVEATAYQTQLMRGSVRLMAGRLSTTAQLKRRQRSGRRLLAGFGGA